MSFINAERGEGTVLVYDSGVVGAGAAITTPILDVRRFGQLAFLCNNADAGTRTLNFSAYVPNSSTAYATGAFATVASGNIWQEFMWGGGFAAGATFATFPPGFLSFSLAASGATNARIVIWGR